MPKPPNILVFLTDDHGQWASSAYGNREIVSPSMKWLADTGARLDRAFTPCPVCSPARASFFTGRYPSSHGIHDYLQEPGRGEGRPDLQGQLLLPELLREAGYLNALCGKWHAGRFWTPASGFDVWFTSALGTNARFGKQAFYEGERLVETHGHQAPVVTDRAIRFLRERPDDRPFFLFVGYTDTHTPLQDAPPRWRSHYEGAGFRDIPEERHDPAVHGKARRPFDRSHEAFADQNAHYYGAVSFIDEQIGRLLDELQSQGQLDDTLAVYTGDHGHMNGHHGLLCKGNTTIPCNFLEESIKVPCLLRWPGRIPPGQARDFPADHCDLFETLLDAASGGDSALRDRLGALKAERHGEAYPGRSYLPLLEGADAEWRKHQIFEYGNSRMIRAEREKLVVRYPGPNGHFPCEYYDLEEDPRETRNRFADIEGSQKHEALLGEIGRFFARFGSEERSGLRVADLPSCNEHETWRLPARPAT